jgi:hypothetical protein
LTNTALANAVRLSTIEEFIKEKPKGIAAVPGERQQAAKEVSAGNQKVPEVNPS